MRMLRAAVALSGEAADSIAHYSPSSQALREFLERARRMTSVSIWPSSATPLRGEFWSTRARDWADLMEPAMRQLYRAILGRLDLSVGPSLLDAGCGSGLFCRLAADSGASVFGLDAAPALLDIARARAPEGAFEIGDLGRMPYDDATFDVVTSINSLEYVSSPVAALREVKRVAKPGARIVVATWGCAEECESAAYLAVIASALPTPPGTPGPFTLSAPGALEQLAKDAALVPEGVADVAVEWNFADLDDALDALLSAGPAAGAIQVVGERRIREAVAEAIRPFGTARGDYRLENTFRYLLARA